jgi:hypothetical protein
MRIALDVSMLGHGGGIPTYAEHLIRGLAQIPGNDLILWCGTRTSQAHVRRLIPEDLEIVEPAFAVRMLSRLGFFACANPLSIDRLVGPVEVFHGLNYLLPSHYGRAARFVTVHDLSILTHPEWHPGMRTRLMARPLPRTVAKAHHVITDCEAVRVEVIERSASGPSAFPGFLWHRRPTSVFNTLKSSTRWFDATVSGLGITSCSLVHSSRGRTWLVSLTPCSGSGPSQATYHRWFSPGRRDGATTRS